MLGWVLLGAAAFGFAALWLRLSRLTRTTNEMSLMLRELAVAYRNTPGAITMLSGVAEQLRPNGGHSLRDVVNRLEKSTARIEAAAAVVASDLEAAHARADKAVGPHGAAADAYAAPPKG